MLALQRATMAASRMRASRAFGSLANRGEPQPLLFRCRTPRLQGCSSAIEQQGHFISLNAMTPFAFSAMRVYSNSQSQSQSPPQTPPSPSPSAPQPQPPNMPDKQQIEKYFFRTLAFIWDTAIWLYAWSKKAFEKHIVENQTVQTYYRQFINKMEKAKKD